MPTYRRQEQEPASAEITEVGPNVLRMQLPIDFTGLGHVNAYALLDERGAAIVDAGMPGAATWAAILDRLGAAGLAVDDVHTVIVTHSHPDHFGCAGRLAHEAGAELVTERRFQTFFDHPQVKAHLHTHDDATDGLASTQGPAGAPAGVAVAEAAPDPDDTGFVDIFERTPWGGPPLTRLPDSDPSVDHDREEMLRIMRPPVPSRRVAHGDRLVLAGREWQCVHTPGHTRDHLCLYDPEARLLLSGDHVLPSITPHVSGITGAPDALKDYLVSLDSLRGIGPVSRVLPAHGHPFNDLDGRIGEIEQHHAERLDEIRRLAKEHGPTSVIDFSHMMFRESHWGLMAESETYAHLEYLRFAGQAESFERDGLLFYDVDTSPLA